jgi:hypothetical protein
MTDLIRKMPVKARVIELDDEWLGWSFTARMNPPVRIFEDIISGEFARITDGLALIIIDWNFVDEEGVALPKPTRDIIASHVPTDLLSAITNRWTDEMIKLPPV